jgi:hypothetical protein
MDCPVHHDSRGNQRCLNATAPTANNHGYAPAFHQNAFGVLEADNREEESIDKSVATQLAVLTYQSQQTANTAANTSMRQEQQLAHLVTQQQLMNQNMHQLIDGLNAVTFNQSNKGRGVSRFAPNHFAPRGYRGGYGGHSCGHVGCGFLGR